MGKANSPVIRQKHQVQNKTPRPLPLSGINPTMYELKKKTERNEHTQED